MDWSKQKFAIIDIETTGGNAATGKTTEIAIYILQNGELVDELVSLVNPEQGIPYFISNLTGIDDKMVRDAPKFYELAKEINRITEGAIFVAHNASFDYGFVKEEFNQLGFNYERKTLCTVQLSRKIIPGYASYSLGKLTDELGIVLNNRHRASGDALATVELFKLLQKTNPQLIEDALVEKKFRFKHRYIKSDIVDNLPETSGLFYLLDKDKNIIYVEKSIEIKSRVISLLNSKNSKKQKIASFIRDVKFIETGSELISLIEENTIIKNHKPRFNSKPKSNRFLYGIYSFKDEKGYICFRIRKNSSKSLSVPIVSFNSEKQCRSRLSDLTMKYQLCQKLSGLAETAGACFYYAIGECKGACIGQESVKAYNNRAQKLIAQYLYQDENFYLVERGRKMNEKTVILIESCVYKGYAYVPSNRVDDLDFIKEQLVEGENSVDIHKLIIAYIKKHSELKKIKF